MDIDEIQKLRRDTERAIESLIFEFTEKTHVAVAHVDYSRNKMVTIGKQYPDWEPTINLRTEL